MFTNPTASVTAMTVSDPSVSQTQITLSFSPSVPSFSIVRNDAATATVVFQNARFAQGVQVPGGVHGLIQSIGSATNSGALSLSLAAKGAIHVEAHTGIGGAVSLSVTAAGKGAATGSGPVPAATAGLVPLQDNAAADETFEVVPLRYADVSEVIGILTSNQNIRPNDSFSPQEPSFGSSSLQGFYGGAGLSTPTVSGGLGGPVSAANEPSESVGSSIDENFGIDRRLNAIILRGSPDRIARLKDEIARLDVAVPSVLFETVFVELTRTGAKNIGIDFDNGNNQIGVVSYSYNSGDYPGVSNTSPHGGLSANLQAAIYAQISKGEGRIVSKPRISAQSGQTAKIVTGDALPILTSIALSGVNAVQQQVQYVNVGVILQIAPRVSDDGFVSSHIYSVVSSVSGYSQGYPTISQREATTSATVRDGESFIIGGLTQETTLHSRSKIPLLGDIPIISSVFANTHDTQNETELYVIVTPHVVPPGSKVDDARARELLAKPR